MSARLVSRLVLVAALLASGACGSGDDSSGPSAPDSTSSTQAPVVPSTTGALADSTISPGVGQPGPKFPLALATDGRYLVSPDGQPFLIQGDSAWSLIAELDHDEVIQYLDARQAAGFNTLLVNLIEHKFASHAPANASGDAPFTSPGDFGAPNEAYFAWADWVLQEAEQRGFLVLLTPSYTGWTGGDEGWYDEMAAAGPDRLRNYGRYVATRLADRRNILWVQGGDHDPPDPPLIDALASGIQEVAPDALQTVHIRADLPPDQVFGDAPWFRISNVYTYDGVAAPSLGLYRATSWPFFLIEGRYENEHDSTVRELRAQAYQSLLCGAMGQVFGNNPMWHFSGPTLYESGSDWQDQLASPGTESMRHVSALFASIPWWTLVPDDGKLLVRDSGDGYDQSVASVSSDGRLALVYFANGSELKLELSALRSTDIRATWFDPADCSRHASTAPITGTTTEVGPPGGNSAGDADWILILEAA
jgi:hypothetical protein